MIKDLSYWLKNLQPSSDEIEYRTAKQCRQGQLVEGQFNLPLEEMVMIKFMTCLVGPPRWLVIALAQRGRQSC
jgi:hypothetical protein